MSIQQTGKKSEKSVKLTDDESKQLKELRETYSTDTAFSEDFNIDRVSLVRITLIGSGSEVNIKKIRRKLSKHKPVNI